MLVSPCTLIRSSRPPLVGCAAGVEFLLLHLPLVSCIDLGDENARVVKHASLSSESAGSCSFAPVHMPLRGDTLGATQGCMKEACRLKHCPTEIAEENTIFFQWTL